MGNMVKEFAYYRRWMDVRDTCLKVGWWKISMNRFFLGRKLANSAGRDVHCQVQQGWRVRVHPWQPIRKVRVVGRCCASWGVIHVTGASIFFRRCPGFCAPSSCAEFSTRRDTHGRHEEKHCFEETRTEAGRVFNSSLKRGACYSFNSSQPPNQGKKLGKELVSPSLLLQLQRFVRKEFTWSDKDMKGMFPCCFYVWYSVPGTC